MARKGPAMTLPGQGSRAQKAHELEAMEEKTGVLTMCLKFPAAADVPKNGGVCEDRTLKT